MRVVRRDVMVARVWSGGREEKEGARTEYTEGLVARFPTGSISVCVRTSDTSAWSGVRTQLSKDRQGKVASHLWAYFHCLTFVSLLRQIHGLYQSFHAFLERRM